MEKLRARFAALRGKSPQRGTIRRALLKSLRYELQKSHLTPKMEQPA
jgi:hypothetical protein